MKSLGSLVVLLTLSFPAAVLSASAGGSSAAAPLKSQRPITANVVQRTLPDGLRVLVLPRHTAPVVTTMMWYRVGSRDELPGATGLAHFLEHLMFKGTHQLGKGAIDQLTYRNGGSNNAFTFNDYTAYEFNFPKRSWKVALGIEADRMRNCAFNKKEFEAERQVVAEERRIGEDDPGQQFAEQLNTLTFLAHPYRNPVIGWMEDIKRVSRDEVYAFYQKYYRPSNCTLVITGDVTPEDALGAAAHAFASVPALPAPEHRTIPEPAAAPGSRRLRLTLATKVPRVALAFRCPSRSSADVYALTVLQYALSEGRQSRLYQRLVEGDRTAADVDSSLGVYKDAGELDVSANAREGVDLEQIETAVWQEIERLAREPLSDRELARAKNEYYADWIHGLETANQLATTVGEADALGGYQYLNTLLERVQAVSPADVRRVARTYLARDRSVVGYLYPKGAASGERSSRAGGEGRSRLAQRRENRSVPARSQPGGALPAIAGPAAPPPAAGEAALPLQRVAARGPLARRGMTGRAPAPTAPPVPAPASGFATLQPTEKLLPNGLRLILLEKHDLPSVTFSARMAAGSNQETDPESGLADMTARMLDEGTRTRDHNAISMALEQVGASFSATAGRETTAATLTTLSPYAADLLPLYAELLRAPSFPADRLEQERSRRLVELQEELDDAGTVARQQFNALVYGAHPAHRPVGGTPATVRSLSPEALERYHARFYQPGRITLVAVGDFRAGDMLERLTEAFGGWNGDGNISLPPLPAVSRQDQVRSTRILMEKAQTQIVLGHLGITRTNPDFLALKVMDTILGEGVSGGFTARIPYQLRDVQGLAYSVGSSISSSAAREPGVFVASLGTEPKNEKTAVAALLGEIRKIRAEPVTEKELREAEDYLANSYVFSFQTNGQLAAYLDAVQYYGLGYNYRQKFVRDVHHVTRADVLRVAKKYLDPEHYTLVVVGPTR